MSAEVFLILRIAAAIALYAFVGWALYVLWQDLKRQSKQLAMPQAPPITLIKPDPVEYQTLQFTSSEVTIGRDPASSCYLEDKTISAKHARLSYHHGQWWVEDLNSTNGTFLNQEPVTEPLVLTTGDQLRCGQVVFEISLSERQSADPGLQRTRVGEDQAEDHSLDVDSF